MSVPLDKGYFCAVSGIIANMFQSFGKKKVLPILVEFGSRVSKTHLL